MITYGDLSALVAQSRKRDFEWRPGVVFKIVLLPEEEVIGPILAAKSDEEGNPIIDPAQARAIVGKSVVGWSGVTGALFTPDGPSDEVEFSPRALVLLMEQRMDVTSKIYAEIMRQVGKRRKEFEAALKNSTRGSSGT